MIEILYPSAFYDINSGKKMSKPANNEGTLSSTLSLKILILEPNQREMDIFIFQASDSKIKGNSEKKFILKKNPSHVNRKVQELA